MNADHGQEPPSGPSADPADTWILIDDTEEAEPPAAAPGDFWTQSTTWDAPSGGAPSGSATATGPQQPTAGTGPESRSQSHGNGGEPGPEHGQNRPWEPGQDKSQETSQEKGPEKGPEGADQGKQGQGQGWDSFASAGTWNGMRASAPGAPGGWGAPRYDPGQMFDAGQKFDTGPAAPEAGQSRPEEPAQDPWFGEDDLAGDFADDDAAVHDSGRMATLTDRLPSLSTLSFGPAFVTFVVLCASVLLTISSIIWHPHVP